MVFEVVDYFVMYIINLFEDIKREYLKQLRPHGVRLKKQLVPAGAATWRAIKDAVGAIRCSHMACDYRSSWYQQVLPHDGQLKNQLVPVGAATWRAIKEAVGATRRAIKEAVGGSRFYHMAGD